MRFLYFVRHGEYTASDEGGVLTARGRQQARLVAKHFKDIPVHTITSSTLSRAEESAEILAKKLKVETIIHTPILVEALPTGLPGLHVPLKWRQDAKQQIQKIIRRYFKYSKQEQHDIYVCHGNIIRALVCSVFNIPLGRWHDLPIYHGSITRFAVEADGEKKFIAFNESGHLPPNLKTGTGFEESFYQ